MERESELLLLLQWPEKCERVAGPLLKTPWGPTAAVILAATTKYTQKVAEKSETPNAAPLPTKDMNY